MQIQQNISLKPYNTFGIEVKAKQFAAFHTVEELDHLTNQTQQKLILGGGSNILLTKNFDGIVLKNEISGIEKTGEEDEHVYIKAGTGENWHRFVLYCIDNNYAGVENLSLIPGCVGASPMQNIGAYGVEIKDVFYELEAFHLADRKIVKFSLSECEFAYRESVFKTKYKNQFVILNVTYRLNKQPLLNISYGAIKEELEKMNVKEITIQAVSDAVINIRSSKLPDPKIIGNAGSFFKNPEIEITQFNQLKHQFPAVPSYPVNDYFIKVPAGWLIEQCGWKGFRRGDAGCHAKQALVLVNYGNASGKEIYNLSEEIKHSVMQKFNISLEREVNLV